MSTPARIDELRKKFDENPRRYFAPLANEYRKAGDLAQAISLCREYLPKQPGHMSGHIVFGQALYEAGDTGEARDVFESALALDPENLIALRHLGDIAKADGDAAGARRWYERVLDADPRNDDIAAQLATLATGNTPRSSRAVQGTLEGVTAGRQPEEAYHAPVPEPDPSMRAVDFDVVNAEVARSTPLYSEVVEARANAKQEPAPLAFEPLDLDAMDSADDPARITPSLVHASTDSAEADAADAGESLIHLDARDEDPIEADSELESLIDQSEPEAQDAPAGFSGNDIGEVAEAPVAADSVADAQRDFEQAEAERSHATVPDDAAAPTTDGVYDGDFSGTEFDDDEFEGGILAPEWPQASELIARIGTPRSSTPISVRVTPDAVAAFGREPHESVPVSAHAPERALQAADESPLVGQSVDAAAVVAAEVSPPAAETDDAGDDRNDVVSGDTTDTIESVAVPVAGDATESVAVDSVDAVGVLDADRDRNSIAARIPSDPTDAQPDTRESAGVEAPGEVSTAEETHAAEAVEHMLAASAASEVVPAAAREETYLADYSGDEHTESDEASFADVQVYDDRTVAEAQSRSETSSAFVTESMGELLVSQGFIERAAEVYEELVRRRPYDPVLTSRLAELRERLENPDAATAERTAPTPSSTQAVALTPPRAYTPQSFTPSSFTPRSFTPQASPAVTPAYHATSDASTAELHETKEAEPVVTAREVFARLAARRVPRRTPAVAMPAVHAIAGRDSEQQDTAADLSSLFSGGGDSQDDSAARALSEAFAPIGEDEMSDGATMDFSGGSESMRTPSSSPVQAAYAPSKGSVNLGGGAPAGATTGGTSFSFDRFFPDPASRATPAAAPADATPTPAPTPAPAPASDDLAEFSAWLKGLGNK